MRDIPVNGVPAFIDLRQREVPVKRGYVRRRRYPCATQAYIKGMRLALDEAAQKHRALEVRVLALTAAVAACHSTTVVVEDGVALATYCANDVKREHENAIRTDAFVALQDIAYRLNRMCDRFRINPDSKIAVRFESVAAGRDVSRALAASPSLAMLNRGRGSPIDPSKVIVSGVEFAWPVRYAQLAPRPEGDLVWKK